MNKKRNWLYLILAVTSIFLVIGKQRSVVQERDQVIVSTTSEWAQKGKPVVVYEVKKRDVELNTKITMRQLSGNVFEGYVSEDTRNRIKVGQQILFDVEGKNFKGTVTMTADSISLDTGMYRVQASFDGSMDIKSLVVAFVHTDTLAGVICIPNEVIDKEYGKSFVWKVQNLKAVRQDVTIGSRDGYGAVVMNGLKEGDLVVINGFFMLSQGDKVNILKRLSAEEL